MSPRKKKPEKHQNHERWLISYADFVTLLFAVFVMLYAMGKVDQQKAEALVASMAMVFSDTGGTANNKMSVLQTEDLRKIPTAMPSDPNPGKGPGDFKAIESVLGSAHEAEFKTIKKVIDKYIAEENIADRLQVSIDERGLVVSLKEMGFFQPGSADLKPGSIELLTHVARALSGFSNNMRIEGHTDNIPMTSRQFESNWELSTKRATNIVHFLVNRKYCSPAQLSAVGYGEYKPVADNSTPEGRSRNRRVDIVMLSEKSKGNY